MVGNAETETIMTLNQRKWWYGLAAGFLGGMWASIDSGMALMLIAPKEFNPDAGLAKTLLAMAVLGVLAGGKVAVAYLKQSPMPPLEGDTEPATKPTNHIMKILLILSLCLAAVFVAKPRVHGAEPVAPAGGGEAAASLYRAGQFSVSPFASYRGHEFSELDGKVGGGLALGYSVSRNVTLELEAGGEEYESAPVVDSLMEAGANAKGYLPIGNSGFAPYGLIGYTRDIDAKENRMNAGAGLEFRFQRAHVFADGRWTHDFRELGHALFRAGLGMRF